MTFEDILDQAVGMLQRLGQVTYRTLQRQFDLDDAALEDLKDQLLFSHPVVDQAGRGLVWTGDPVASPPTSTPGPPTPPPAPRSTDQAREPVSDTPQHLAEKILTSRRALEGERKVVTVLFADIKDSTELIKDLDPEDAQQLLDPAIHIMMDAVHRFEGTVNQVLGDGIMALFGAPIAHEDHAARACYAALAMQTAMQPYVDAMFRIHGITMQIRVGLNSGEVVVRTIGNDLHMDYSAVGQTTHLAARMEQLAAPGSITLTGATLRLVEGLWETGQCRTANFSNARGQVGSALGGGIGRILSAVSLIGAPSGTSASFPRRFEKVSIPAVVRKNWISFFSRRISQLSRRQYAITDPLKIFLDIPGLSADNR